MNGEIALVLGILAADLVLFVHGGLRMDLVALLSLSALAVTGLVTPAEALSGFASPAVTTVGSVFVLSGALSRTGVTRILSRRILQVARGGEARLRVSLMLAGGLLSTFFVSNVGVAALLLPVAMDLARATGVSPSRLLLPMSYAVLMGGLTTLIGTPSNILVSDALRERGLEAFGLFDYTPVGLAVLGTGLAFLTLVGRRLLPSRRGGGEMPSPPDVSLEERYGLSERLLTVRIPPGSPLAGTTVAESRLGSALGLQLVASIRDGRTVAAPGPEHRLRVGEVLLLQGRADALEELGRSGASAVLVEEAFGGLPAVAGMTIAEIGLAPDSSLAGRTLREVEFLHRYGVRVLAILRDGVPRRSEVQDVPLRVGDTLLVQGPSERIRALADAPEVVVSPVDHADLYRIHERLFGLSVEPGSFLAGRTLRESRLGEGFGLRVLTVIRSDETIPMPGPEEVIREGDVLVAEGRTGAVQALRGLKDLETAAPGEGPPRIPVTERVGLAELALSPHSGLVGRTLRQVDFRRKYGLTVLAIWREGRPLRSNLRDLPLRFGDALLVHGPRESLRVLAKDPDFLVLTEGVQEPPRTRKAPLAAGVLLGALLPVYLGWLPIAIAVLAGAALVVLLGCVTMDEAYRAIEWQAVILIAGMLPLGIALDRTGTAAMLAQGVVATAGGHGPRVVLAAVFLVTSALTQVIPTAALVVLMAPVVLGTAAGVGVSPYPLMMGMAMAASASFASPISHPANVLIMGPGGYRFVDYLRLGLPLTGVIFVVVVLVTPLVFPF